MSTAPKNRRAAIHRIADEVAVELARAVAMHPAMHSPHEGYAVILEELDELKAEVWKKPRDQDPALLRAEAIQVAAMGMRFVLDLCAASPVVPPAPGRSRSGRARMVKLTPAERSELAKKGAAVRWGKGGEVEGAPI